MKATRITDFVSANSQIIASLFVKNSQEVTLKSKLYSLFYRIKLSAFQIWAFTFLMFAEPLLVVSQMQLRRNGGLASASQWHRLYEIRETLKKVDIASGIEFGSGASTILFTKYLQEFISIEESSAWRNSLLKRFQFYNLSALIFFAKSRSRFWF